jgi:hypothetical protein
MRIDDLVNGLGAQVDRLADARSKIDRDIAWYPYDILANLVHLDGMLSGDNRDLDWLAQGLPVADIGAADGDLAFALEALAGWQIDILDTAATNMNGLRGAIALREHLGSRVAIHDIDLDRQFALPREHYGLVFFLGILYHLQNPYYALRELAAHSDNCLMSTKVARFAGSERTPIGELPVGYLVAPHETNNDPTNYWILSPTGVERLAERTGWIVVEKANVGNAEESDPSTPENDERMFLLLRSASSERTPNRSRMASEGASEAEPSPFAAAASDLGLQEAEPPLICWPLDHFYSPIANTRALRRDSTRSRVWPSAVPETPGMDWRPDAQISLLSDHFARQSAFPIPDAPTGNTLDYHAVNEMFSRLDAWILQAMLRHLGPRRVIEVGCGWSSLVTARVNREYFGSAINFTCIEPYPPEFLADGIEGISRLLISPVEEVPVAFFQELSSGDVLFVDSSHTVKTGGDVVFLMHEVLPRLSAGVAVHIHDIFLPWDYPEEWVMSGRAWNEQYAVRAFLSFNHAFEVLIGVAWISQFHPEVLARVLPEYPEKYPDGGGSLWIRRLPDPGAGVR